MKKKLKKKRASTESIRQRLRESALEKRLLVGFCGPRELALAYFR